MEHNRETRPPVPAGSKSARLFGQAAIIFVVPDPKLIGEWKVSARHAKAIGPADPALRNMPIGRDKRLNWPVIDQVKE